MQDWVSSKISECEFMRFLSVMRSCRQEVGLVFLIKIMVSVRKIDFKIKVALILLQIGNFLKGMGWVHLVSSWSSLLKLRQTT